MNIVINDRCGSSPSTSFGKVSYKTVLKHLPLLLVRRDHGFTNFASCGRTVGGGGGDWLVIN